MILKADPNAFDVPVWHRPSSDRQLITELIDKHNTEYSKLNSKIDQLTKKYDTLMASPIVQNNLELQKTVYSAKEADIQLSKDNVLLREENTKLQKEYLDLKTRTETTQDIEVSDLSGSVSTGGIVCLSITAIGFVTAAYVMNDSMKRRKSQKGSMYLIDKEEI